jgi:hypothetical protein
VLARLQAMRDVFRTVAALRSALSVHRDLSLAKISAAQKVARFSSFATAWESLNLIKNCFEDREVLARAGTGVRACCAYVSRMCYV